MEKVAVEEEDIAGIHLNVDNRKTLEDCGNAFLVGAGGSVRAPFSPKPAEYSASASSTSRRILDIRATITLLI
jgi:hypothetical protein